MLSICVGTGPVFAFFQVDIDSRAAWCCRTTIRNINRTRDRNKVPASGDGCLIDRVGLEVSDHRKHYGIRRRSIINQ